MAPAPGMVSWVHYGMAVKWEGNRLSVQGGKLLDWLHFITVSELS